jgi:hypothetical protein
MSSTSLDGHDLKLGLFSSNCTGELAMTIVAERWDASWSGNLRLARLADDTSIDFILPIARWIGYHGTSDSHQNVLEPIPLRHRAHRVQPPGRQRQAPGHHRPARRGPRGAEHRGGRLARR